MAACLTCSLPLPPTRRSNGFQRKRCPSCAKAHHRRACRRRSRRDRSTLDFMARRRQWLYGLTPEQQAALLERQGGLCACCRTAPATDIDHDHAFARGDAAGVRGYLCHPCNTMLGFARDNPEILRLGILYLEQWKSSRS